MCSIIGSFDRDKIIDLIKLNLYRGQHSYSISYYNVETKTIDNIKKDLGSIPFESIDIPEGHYCIAHMQAPTTSNKSIESIHPAFYEEASSYLWHNGIVKDHCIKEMMFELLESNSWDTYLILKQFETKKTLDGIDGTFSCLYYKEREGLKLFRNEISPLFIDDNDNISSTKFENSFSLEPNIVWNFIPGEDIIEEYTFSTVENPYFFMDV